MPQKRKTDKPRFIFHGNAIPFGGRMVSISGKPFLDPIPGPPSGSLPVVGGWNRAVSKGSSYRDTFSWGATLANSKGELRADGHFITTVTSSIADVHAKNDPFPFEAGRLSITIVSDHFKPDDEPSIAPTEIVFEGLRLDGQPIELELDKDLIDYPTFTGYCLKHPVGRRTSGGYIVTSFVRSIRWRNKKIKGNVLSLKGFGKIYFGEVLMNEYNRRVTLVRLAMGSTVEAEAAYAEADPNGTWGN
jgi:hypothetical protein